MIHPGTTWRLKPGAKPKGIFRWRAVIVCQHGNSMFADGVLIRPASEAGHIKGANGPSGEMLLPVDEFREQYELVGQLGLLGFDG